MVQKKAKQSILPIEVPASVVHAAVIREVNLIHGSASFSERDDAITSLLAYMPDITLLQTRGLYRGTLTVEAGPRGGFVMVPTKAKKVSA